MKERKNGFHDVFGVELRRVTSILGRLARFGLDDWQASCAVDFMMSELVLPLSKGWMSLEQLRETDLDRVRKAAKDESRKRMKAAQTIGRRVHGVIKDYYAAEQRRDLIDQVVRLEKDLELPLRAFTKWEDDYDVESIHSERPVFSFSRKYSGTLDLQAKITLPNENFGPGSKRRLCVIDFKTGAPDPVSIIQIAAYVVAVEEMDRTQLDGAGLVYLDQETGRPRWKGFERRELLIPFMMFEKIKGFVELEDELRRKGDIEEGPPSDTDTSPADTPTAETPAGPPTFE